MASVPKCTRVRETGGNKAPIVAVFAAGWITAGEHVASREVNTIFVRGKL
jgi:hypothetical protein